MNDPGATVRRPDLATIQRWMREWIASPPRDPSVAVREAARRLVAVAGDFPARRLEVYADAYAARATEALAETYETIARILGPTAFASLAGRYVARHPSRHPNLGRLGDLLPAFLATDPLTADLPFLPDLARLEQAAMAAYHAASLPPLAAGALAQLDPAAVASARLHFQPHVFVVRSAWPVRTLRERRHGSDAELAVRVVDRPEDTVGWRAGLDVTLRAAVGGEASCLAALRAGASVGEALGELAEEDAPHVADWFASWTAAGLVVAIDVAIDVGVSAPR